MTFYTPDLDAYQQLDEPRTGWADCTAYSGAILLDAHTQGRRKTTGRAVRLNSDEPVPDPRSPGLNEPQVDDSIRRITGGVVDLDTRVGYRALNRTEIRNRAVDGRWFTGQLYRGTLVDRGYGGGNGFRGGHALTVHTLLSDPNVPILGDPLVSHYTRCMWDTVFDAMERCPGTGGALYTQWTRDLTPDYHAVIRPPKGSDLQGFAYFVVRNGQIVDSRPDVTAGMDVDCTPPRYWPNKAGGKGRMLVQITEGKRKGRYVDDRWAREKVP